MNQTIRLSARRMPGTERTRCTYVSENVCAKSTFGVFFEVTQSSAWKCSIVIEALSRRPRRSPPCTKTSITANATPATVIRKRRRSWSRFFRASEPATSGLLVGGAGGSRNPRVQLQPADHRVDRERGGFVERPPVDPRVVAFRHLQRDDTVHARPHDLRHELRVLQGREEALLLDRLGHGRDEERVGVLLRVPLPHLFRVVRDRRVYRPVTITVERRGVECALCV